MRASGYSQRPLFAKLGVGPETRGVVLGAPADYERTLGDWPRGLERRARLAAGETFDWIQFFTASRAVLERRLPELRRAIFPAGALWISWPKRASGVATDLTEDVVRALAFTHGLVDIKVCAVDTTWSGLKLVVPLLDRPRKERAR